MQKVWLGLPKAHRKDTPIAADSAFLLPMNTQRPHPSFDLIHVFVSAAYLETLFSWKPIGHTRKEIRPVSHSANTTDFLTWKMRISKDDLETLCVKCDVSINTLPVGVRKIFRRGGRKTTRARGHEIYIYIYFKETVSSRHSKTDHM